MTSPLVAVVIPVFNRPRPVVEAVQSVLAERDVALELIVVDDGSTDGTSEVVASLPSLDPRIIVVHQPNAGQSAARNAGVAVSTARFVTFLDSDDLFEPGRLTIQLDAWHRHADERPVVVGRERVLIGEGVEPPIHIVRRIAIGGHLYHTSALLLREDFDAVGGFDPELRLAEDVDFVLRLQDAGTKLVEIDDVLITRRVGGDNLVYDPDIQRSWLVLLRRRTARQRARHAVDEV